MDSMRSLNTSLPSSNTPTTQPPELLLQSFKTAALSVTNLYKNAVADQASSRHVGYQDALEDLRAFLDKEKLGHNGGESAKIRSWVMEKIDGSGTMAGDSDDDRDSDKRNRSSSPVAVRKASPDRTQTTQPSRSTSPPRSETPAPTQTFSANESNFPPRSSAFTFTAGPQFPASQPQQGDADMRSSDNLVSVPHDTHLATPQLASPSVRVEVLPRGSRAPHRLGSSNRHNNRSLTRDSAPNTGSKRKLHFGEFFDISSLGNGRDTFGGGKRGRFS